MREVLFTSILPSVALFCVGYITGGLFETLWMRFVFGLSAGTGAYFLFRQWGKWVLRKEER